MELNNGNAKFKITPTNLEKANTNLLVDIYATLNTLIEITLSKSAKTDEDFDILSKKFQATFLKKREQILSNLYKDYGTVDINDIVE